MEETNDAISSRQEQQPTTIVSTMTTVTGNGTQVDPQTLEDFESDSKWENFTTLEKASYDCSAIYNDNLQVANSDHLAEVSSESFNKQEQQNLPHSSIGITPQEQQHTQDTETDLGKNEEMEAEFTNKEMVEDEDNCQEENLSTKEQNNSLDNEGVVEYHSMMNAAPETAEEVSVQEETQPQPQEPEQLAEMDVKLQEEEEEEEDSEPATNHSENQPTDEKVNANISNNTDSNEALPNASMDDGASILSQTSVDAQMERVIDNIVELGGCQQFGQTLEQQGGLLDREKEVEDIQREIREQNVVNERQEELTNVESQIENQQASVEPEKHTRFGGLTQQFDLKLTQKVDTKEVERSSETKMQEEIDQKDAIEGQRNREASSPSHETKTSIVPPKEQEKAKAPLEENVVEETANETAKVRVNLDVADHVEENSQEHGVGEKKVISSEEEVDRQVEKQEKKPRRGSSRKNESSSGQNAEDNKIEDPPKQEVQAERRSSRRIKVPSKVKEDEVNEPPTTTPRRRKVEIEEKEPPKSSKKKEDKKAKDSKGQDEEEKVAQEETPAADDECKEKEKEKEKISQVAVKPVRGVRAARTTRKSMPAELPKVKLERKSIKRSLEKDDSYDKSVQPVIKNPAVVSRSSAASAAKSTVPTSAPSSGTKTKAQMSPNLHESKKYQCEHCSYSTDRLNNIVYHKKSSCSYAQKHFAESVEKWKQTLQSPKSNNKRSSR